MGEIAIYICSPTKDLYFRLKEQLSACECKVLYIENIEDFLKDVLPNEKVVLVLSAASFKNTLSALRILGSSGDVNIIVLEDFDNDNLTPQDIVDIYNSGAVDFVKADMPIAVIGAKIRAYIRRLSTVKVPPAEGGAIRFDASTRRVFVPERGRWVTVSSLTPKEFSILWYLASKKGDVATRVEILDSIWNADALKVNMETVDKHVESLRKKLGKYARSVKTVYGSGYYFDKESIEEELKAKGA